MPISNFPGGFRSGVTIRNVPVNIAYPGKVFWLNNSSVPSDGGVGGSDSNQGTYKAPFSSLMGALANCVSGRGDVIMVMPGHAETIASPSAYAIASNGVAIVGLGIGDQRPTFTMGTANTSTLNISGNSVTIHNCLFKANFAGIVAAITLSGKSLTLSNCEFRDNSSILNFARVVSTSATSNACDGLWIENCQMLGLGATANSCLVRMQGTNDRLVMRGNYVAHKATSDAGLMPIASGKVVTNMICDNNIINLVGATGVTTGIIITTDGSTNSGVICRNFIKSLDATTEILVTASSGFIYYNNYYSGAADTSGYLLPVADA